VIPQVETPQASEWLHAEPAATLSRGSVSEVWFELTTLTPERLLDDDRELIGRVLTGDASAERELYEAHVARVYRLAYRLAGDRDRAEDYTQETFIRAFDHLETFRGHSTLSTWIVAIALSVTLNGLRKTKRLRTREVIWDSAPEVGSGRRVEPDLKTRLTRAIDDLPELYRTVFVMHDVEGYTHEEIAETLGVPAGTSKARLFRARGRLRGALADFAKE
jgi:RNA polymerase sigma-70 factor, ECF subfamily